MENFTMSACRLVETCQGLYLLVGQEHVNTTVDSVSLSRLTTCSTLDYTTVGDIHSTVCKTVHILALPAGLRTGIGRPLSTSQ